MDARYTVWTAGLLGVGVGFAVARLAAPPGKAVAAALEPAVPAAPGGPCLRCADRDAADDDEGDDEGDEEDNDDDDDDDDLSDSSVVPPGVELKMVVLVRQDLNMSKGKIAAQVGHAVLACYRIARRKTPEFVKVRATGRRLGGRCAPSRLLPRRFGSSSAVYLVCAPALSRRPPSPPCAGVAVPGPGQDHAQGGRRSHHGRHRRGRARRGVGRVRH